MTKFLTQRRLARILADMRPLDEELRAWRDSHHLTDAEAARACGMIRSQWNELVSGRTSDPRASTLGKLADGTSLPLERLLAAAELSRERRHPLVEATA